jgi:hypothetical protein
MRGAAKHLFQVVMFHVVMLSKAKHLMPHKFIPLRVTYSCVHRTRF